MPPHAQMSAAQMLLMRAAIAAFWDQPYERRLVRWGTRLHDDCLLPEFCALDFRDAIGELRSLGAPLDPEWFAPHLAFRFPLIGEVTLRDMRVEIRHALEPWHVLAEESAAGGTARYVGSSLERVQVKVDGFVPERFTLACNGAAIPLARTETPGSHVAGVRFKAWAPPSAPHPMLPVHTPLTFDLWDSWTGRSLGGATYHVAHRGGRNDETFPVNANEAEARRHARFLAIGHMPGPMPAPKQVPNPTHLHILDLRRMA
jgi:uncharacterized protein (DUF2126 family)